jgi:glycosyltransferase involved in cell wall biosynthesis
VNNLLTLAHKAWRLLPEEWRSAGMTQAAALVAPRPDVPPPHSRGAVLAGDNGGHYGIAESSRVIQRALVQLGMDRGIIPFGLPSVVPTHTSPLPDGAAVIAVVNAPLMPVAGARLPRPLLRGRRMIGMWVWELPVVPPAWRIGAEFVHDVWAPSRFCADAFETVAPGRVHVVPYPLAAVPQGQVTGDRASFGLPADCFIVLCVFNLASSFTRKNPLASIAAFRAAFGCGRDALLVLKVSGAERHTADLIAIRDAIGDAANIRLIVTDLPEPELHGLLAASDVILSLHRAEGFGLIPAMGALLGKPVIATGWSGNLQFMSPETSALISYKLIPVVDELGMYKVSGAHWADPDVEEAAVWLKRLFADSSLRQQMGAEGKAHAERALGVAPLQAALAAAGITA